MSWLNASDLKPFSGAYVKVEGERPRAWRSRECPERTNVFGLPPGHSDFHPHAWEGILGRKLEDSTEDVTFFRVDGEFEQGRITRIDELWRPAKNAVRYVCNLCAKSHPVGVALTREHQHFSLRTEACSLCKKAPRYDGITTPGLKGVFKTWPAVWRFESLDDLLDHLRDCEFREMLKAHNDDFYIYEARVTRDKSISEDQRIWEYIIKSKAGQYIRALDPGPPTVIDWESYFDLQTMKDRFCRGRSNDGRIAWGWPTTT